MIGRLLMGAIVTAAAVYGYPDEDQLGANKAAKAPYAVSTALPSTIPSERSQ